jgi:hypothetical protein
VTSEISSSKKLAELKDPENCAGGAAADPPPDAASDAPASPNTGTVLFDRFALEICFDRGTAEFLSAFASQKKSHSNQLILTSFRSRLIAVSGILFPAKRSASRSRGYAHWFLHTGGKNPTGDPRPFTLA